jgi:sporulation protein YlmC with PRC-barrel domain
MTVSERPTIAKGALVLARDGEDVGVVDEVRLDAATGDLRGFVLRIGGVLRTLLGGGDAIQVGREEVARVEEGAVHLRLAREELERRAS